MRKIIIDMVKMTILEREINDMLWPKIILAITYIKNLRPIQALKRFISLIEIQN